MKRLIALALLIAPAAAASPDGAALYVQQCSLCHQADARGAPGQYPPLRSRVGTIAASTAGRHYLADLLINGMSGAIKAGGATYVGYMPSFRQLPDDQIAAILTHVAGLDTSNSPAITTADVAAARARGPIAPGTVHAERADLGTHQTLP